MAKPEAKKPEAPEQTAAMVPEEQPVNEQFPSSGGRWKSDKTGNLKKEK